MADKNLTADERFLRVKKDPRFWEMPEKECKIKIDKRFQSMFHDKRFKLKYTVDKRGRPINHSSTEDLKRFYALSDSDEPDGHEDKDEGKKKKKKQKSKTKVDSEKGRCAEEATEGGEVVDLAVKTSDEAGRKQTVKSKDIQGKSRDHKEAVKFRGVKEEGEGEESDVESDDDLEADSSFDEDDDDDDNGSKEEGDEEEDEESDSEGESEEDSDSDSGPDLARGKGNIETSSDEEDDDVEELLRREEEEIEHDWGELWKDAPRNDTVTRRLAVCNIDWDRLKAKDLLALFNSFKPKGGVVFSVKKYPSEFGKERMQAEQTQGPLELVTLPEDPDKDTEEEKIYREKMREYQFKRMRYFYAVVECDSPDTASKIYDECDGFEYESSCSILDLRFIPDDVTFDEEPKDVATDVDLASYTPKYFTSTATATSKVELTWDETDHERVTTLSKKFKKDEILDMDFQAYLASSSEEEEEEEEEEKEAKSAGDTKSESEKKSKRNDAEQIAKYRELLRGIQDKDSKQQDKAMEMEITWVPGLKETTEQLVKKKLEGKDKLTPWEEFLEKKKQKKKQKKANAKQESDLSDDELPPDVDLNDPYFAEELEGTSLKKKTKLKKNKKLKEEERTPAEEEALEKQRAEMALLMDDEEDDKHKHFNYDKIVEHQNLSKKKRKKLQKKNELLEEDDFEVDVKDPRFQAMFTSHLYNLDPSDPGYRKTKATQSILEEKLRRREEQQQSREEAVKRKLQGLEQEADGSLPKAGSKKTMDPGLSMLIKSIKNKTEQFQARKKQKTK
ncbi:ESF1 homolog [Megalops cyprinoides]|uniref:ESF1 homolog n=1 Tax=Megalops cyprinoides TaxID=118141 RepID=UPI00186472E9|nr:ESF1 homolog [Megalops cyprinoides]